MAETFSPTPLTLFNEISRRLLLPSVGKVTTTSLSKVAETTAVAPGTLAKTSSMTVSVPGVVTVPSKRNTMRWLAPIARDSMLAFPDGGLVSMLSGNSLIASAWVFRDCTPVRESASAVIAVKKRQSARQPWMNLGSKVSANFVAVAQNIEILSFAYSRCPLPPSTQSGPIGQRDAGQDISV